MTMDDYKQQTKIQTDAAAEQTATDTAMRSALSQVQDRKHNPHFLERFSDPDINGERWNWLENDFSPRLSRAHMLANRKEEFEEQAQLLNANRGEREVTRHNPGRLLKQNPVVLAAMQGVSSMDDPEAVRPFRSADREAVRDAMEVATARMSIGVSSTGTDALTKATTEHQTVKHEEQEKSGLKARVSGVFD